MEQPGDETALDRPVLQVCGRATPAAVTMRRPGPHALLIGYVAAPGILR